MRELLIAALILSSTLVGSAQTVEKVPFQIYGGWSRFSNSFNGVPGSENPLEGWDASVAFPDWHHLRFKVDVSGFNGTNLNAPQHPIFIMGGPQYEHVFHGERVFVHTLFGEASLNRYWGANGIPGQTATFTIAPGGGIDTPLGRHFAIRAQGDLMHTNTALIESVKQPYPYRIPGLPQNFARVSVGLVWIPKVERVPRLTQEEKAERAQGHKNVEQDLAFEGQGSVGHFHIFAYSWWSDLQFGGIEYDRHSWGSFIGARVDYVAELLPVVILHQPINTDVFGDNHSGTQRRTNPGLGVTPIGLRLLWRNGKALKPYYSIKLGIVGFTHKALSNYASYEDFSMQQSIGMLFRLSDRWDLRAGVSDFHFSNAFVVPSNPGIDEMMYQGALSYHLKSRKAQ
jgi:hypothetical protein